MGRPAAFTRPEGCFRIPAPAGPWSPHHPGGSIPNPSVRLPLQEKPSLENHPRSPPNKNRAKNATTNRIYVCSCRRAAESLPDHSCEEGPLLTKRHTFSNEMFARASPRDATQETRCQRARPAATTDAIKTFLIIPGFGFRVGPEAFRYNLRPAVSPVLRECLAKRSLLQESTLEICGARGFCEHGPRRPRKRPQRPDKTVPARGRGNRSRSCVTRRSRRRRRRLGLRLPRNGAPSDALQSLPKCNRHVRPWLRRELLGLLNLLRAANENDVAPRDDSQRGFRGRQAVVGAHHHGLVVGRLVLLFRLRRRSACNSVSQSGLRCLDNVG